MQFECGHAIATRAELDGLFEQGFDAVFLAPGYDRPYSLGLGASASTGVLLVVGLPRAEQGFDRRARSWRAALSGQNVVVVGGGAVAMDCAVTARHLGADRVYAVALEAMEQLPADEEELDLAFREGIRFKPNSRLTRIVDEHGAVTGVHGAEIRWLEPGRFVPQNAADVPGSEFALPAAVVVEAIGSGFSAEASAMLSGLAGDNGRRQIDPLTMRFSDARLFGGGDLVAAGKTVAASVLDGKRAAQAIAEAFPLRAPVAIPAATRPSLEIDFCGVRCVNPFFLSSSPVGNTAEMIARAFDAGWGGAVYKTLNLETRFRGRSTPRRGSTRSLTAIERFIGLQNMEQISERPLADNLEDIAWLKQHYPDRVLVASIMGYSDEGWVELATRSEATGADMLELNVSCPQMACEGAGHRVGQDNVLLERYSRVVKEHVSIPVMVKLTPERHRHAAVGAGRPARRGRRGGDHQHGAVHQRGRPRDLRTHAVDPGAGARSAASPGRRSSPSPCASWPSSARALRWHLPVSGIGGIETWRDAAMFLLLGATNLQVTTAVMHYGYRIVESMREGLEDYLETLGLRIRSRSWSGRAWRRSSTPPSTTRPPTSWPGWTPRSASAAALCHVVCHDGANQAMGFNAVHAQGRSRRGALRRLPALPARVPGVGLRRHRAGGRSRDFGHAS